MYAVRLGKFTKTTHPGYAATGYFIRHRHETKQSVGAGPDVDSFSRKPPAFTQ
jgi:hypothetical protein